MRVHVVIPAHDEAAGIESTIASVWQQTVRPHDVTVVADNCTADTAAIALANGAQVFETVANRHRKAGALNQFLESHLPLLSDTDVVLVMDADTRLSPRFIEIAADLLRSQP